MSMGGGSRRSLGDAVIDEGGGRKKTWVKLDMPKAHWRDGHVYVRT
jgi:hypothetical protein